MMITITVPKQVDINQIGSSRFILKQIDGALSQYRLEILDKTSWSTRHKALKQNEIDNLGKITQIFNKSEFIGLESSVERALTTRLSKAVFKHNESNVQWLKYLFFPWVLGKIFNWNYFENYDAVRRDLAHSTLTQEPDQTQNRNQIPAPILTQTFSVVQNYTSTQTTQNTPPPNTFQNNTQQDAFQNNTHTNLTPGVITNPIPQNENLLPHQIVNPHQVVPQHQHIHHSHHTHHIHHTTQRNRMLHDISTHVNHDIGELFKGVFEKFDQSLFLSWQMDHHGYFHLHLAHPLKLWIPSVDHKGTYPKAGVVLLFGMNEQGHAVSSITGKLERNCIHFTQGYAIYTDPQELGTKAGYGIINSLTYQNREHMVVKTSKDLKIDYGQPGWLNPKLPIVAAIARFYGPVDKHYIMTIEKEMSLHYFKYNWNTMGYPITDEKQVIASKL